MKQQQRNRHKRWIRFQRQLMVTGIALGLCALVFAGLFHRVPNAWLTLPPGYYQPEQVALANGSPPVNTSPLLKPLPNGQYDHALAQKLEQVVASYPKTLKPHLTYYHLYSQRNVHIAADEPVAAASVIKLPILLQYGFDLEQGHLSPHSHLQYKPFHQALGSGMLQYRPTHQPLLADWVAREMIQSSDNSCTNMLVYYLGGVSRINSLFKQWGLKQTQVSNWLPDLNGTNTISTQDMATILYNLAQSNTLFSPGVKQQLFDILLGTHNRRLIPSALPENTLVAHKTGDIGTSLGESAIVFLPHHQSYILTIQVERPHNHYSAKALIHDLSKTIYQHVINQPPPQTLALAKSRPSQPQQAP